MYVSIGSEVEVLPDLLLSGAFAHINVMMIEWHARLAKSSDRKKLSNVNKFFNKFFSSESRPGLAKSADRKGMSNDLQVKH